MAEARKVERLGKRAVDAAKPAASAYRLWDADLKGFGLKVAPTGVKTYFVWYRVGSGRNAPRREYTIGRHGPLTPDQARGEAERVLGRVSLGEDPQGSRHRARAEMTLGEICDHYLSDGVATKKASTLATDRTRIDRHIKPLLGRRIVSDISSADVERFMRDVAAGKTAVTMQPKAKDLKAQGLNPAEVLDRRRRKDPVARGGKGTASRTVGLLGGIFTYAVKRGLRPDNPVRGVTRYRDQKSQRFLTGEELKRLADSLSAATANGANGAAVTVIRLLILTGARRSEIEHLRWDAVDHDHACLRLRDSKTGARIVPIGAAALEALAAVTRVKGSPFVFPSAEDKSKPYAGTPKVWERQVRPAAGLDGVRLHDLRHTYASIAAAGGQSLPVIGAILGHRDVKTTAQYAHLADDPVRAAADRTSRAAAAAMAGTSAEVVPMKRGSQ